ncbi:hypothetical protein GUJ93_ZPchr0014g47064 [Zizania palustris]|uniref:Uncharacterized protein n=1 Tax=Zizania palustris TaxID=103762 RepID=A0A8J5TG60_ZIZPA|nr:hypothetical protein GUJ93_ZPchr0014g47064 [Zizania palustris]
MQQSLFFLTRPLADSRLCWPLHCCPMDEIPEESTTQRQQVHGCSSYPASFPSQPPDIKNWFSSYVYESPEVPELAAGHGGDSGSETQDPLEDEVPDSLLEHTTHDGDAASRGNHCGGQHEHEVSSIRDLVPTGRCSLKPGAKRKQSLRSLFGADFLDDRSKPTETDSRGVVSVERTEAELLTDCNIMGITEHSKLSTDCDSISLADTQDGSQGYQEMDHSRLPVNGDGTSSSHTEKSKPQDSHEHSKHTVNCTSTSIPHNEIHSGIPEMDGKERGETAGADGFVVIKRKDEPGQAPKISRILKPSTRREKAMTQENSCIMERTTVVQGSRRSPLADRTNVSEVAAGPAPELRGKWKCPRKGKPSIGPPLKQLRLAQWVRRVD